MNLIIFDVDGTLTETDDIDGKCFVRAFKETFQVEKIETDWSKYRNTTDSGIALEIFLERFNREPAAEEIERFKAGFIELLNLSYDNQTSDFSEIRGAAKTFERLVKEKTWAVAIATGCWQKSAELKLKAIGIETFGIPFACAEDAISRADILQAAINRALRFYNQKHFERVVSVGDGVWDVRAASELRIPFLGIGNDARAKKLKSVGANLVLENYADFEKFVEYLNKAEIPRNANL